MGLFGIVRKCLFDEPKSNKVENLLDNNEPHVHSIEPEQEVQFESDTIVPICASDFLDTTSPLAIAKYRSNLKHLVAQAKQFGKIEKFMTIRNDDFFPYDWQWTVSSKDTCFELVNNKLSLALKTTIAMKNAGSVKHENFWVPSANNSLNDEMSKLDKNLGAVLMPVKFRSTKHFTINTPLTYTGEYNVVKVNRNFTIIDTASTLLESGYAYSADYRDAYLDVTHEGLKISEQAIVLISEDKYSFIMNDPAISKQLHDRRVIVYRGDEAVAINMILSEMGVLPARPGNKYIVYDNEIIEILRSSMERLCAEYDIEYSKGHGNIDGKGGHFSDLYDGYNRDFLASQQDFIEFLRNKYPSHSNLINNNILDSDSRIYELIELVGVEQLLSTIEEYNKMMRAKLVFNFRDYKDERQTITPEISMIFKKTVCGIRKFYQSEPNNVSQQFIELVCLFYHSNSVEEQLLAATKICSILGIEVKNEDYTSSYLSV